MNINSKKFNRWRKHFGLGLALVWLALLLAACGGSATPVAPTATVNRPTESAPTTAPVATVVALPTPSPQLPTATTRPTESAPTTAPVATVVASPTPNPPPPTATTAAAQPANFSGTIAHDHLKVLTEQIGIRAAGTPNHEKAADYIENYFKSLGLKTERPSVNFTSFVDKGSWIRYNDGQAVEVKGSVFRQSASADVTAPLAYAGKAANGQLPKASLQGKIALIERGDLTFHDKVANAKNAGAVGVVMYNNQAGLLSSGVIGEEFGLPVLGISQAEGQKLVALLQKGEINLQLNVQFTQETRSFTNVVGVRQPLAATANPAPLIIIGGHFDSVPAGPGANDNGSGTVITMELARVLQQRYPGYELRFIAFGGEEIGLLGSDDYANKMSQADRKRVAAMINIDMVTVGKTLEFGGTPKLVQFAFAAANELGAGDVQALPNALNGSSDHASFLANGMPAIFFYRDGDPNYHQPTDTSDKVTPDRLEILGNIVIKVIDKLSNS